MKHLLLIGALLVSVLSFGQQVKSEKEQYKAEVKEKFRTLELNDDQNTKFEEIQMKYYDKKATVNTSKDTDAVKAKSIKEMEKDKEKELKAIMTKDQYKRYTEIRKKEDKKDVKDTKADKEPKKGANQGPKDKPQDKR